MEYMSGMQIAIYQKADACLQHFEYWSASIRTRLLESFLEKVLDVTRSYVFRNRRQSKTTAQRVEISIQNYSLDNRCELQQ